MEKKCQGCGLLLDIKSFNLHKSSPDGYFSKCKRCVSERAREIRHARIANKSAVLTCKNGEVFKEHATGMLVSNTGRVYVKEGYVGTKFMPARFPKFTLMNTGYNSVSFGLNRRYNVHRLVAETFIENPNNYKCVNHKDFNKLNNNVENLEWCSLVQNLRHATLADKHAIKLTREDVIEIRESTKTVKELSELYKVSNTNIRLILKRKIWKHV